jgi:hypothetical protein
MYENGKMRHVETIPGMRGEGEIKENAGGSEFDYDIFVNVTITPSARIIKKNKRMNLMSRKDFTVKHF